MDLHLLPKVEDRKSIEAMAELVRIAGYSAVGLTVPTGLMDNRLPGLREPFEGRGIKTLVRADLAPRSREELLKLLRRYRDRFDLIAVKCLNSVTASVAARDRRVDMIFFDCSNRNVHFSHTHASLLRGAMEFNLAADLIGAPPEVFLRVAKQASLARSHNTRVVISSGATLPEKVRSSHQLQAIGKAIGLSSNQAHRGVTEVPCSIVERNLERRSTGYIEEGVRIIPHVAA